MGTKIIEGMESHIELEGFTARHYDRLMNVVSLGQYDRFIRSAMRGLNVQPGERILDLGCGTGRNLDLIRRNSGNGFYAGVDIGEDMLKQARERFQGQADVQIENASILEPLPFTEPFDHITTSFVLHGFSHEQRLQIVNQAAAQLREGGRFSFLDWTPADPKSWPLWFRFFFSKVECPIAYEFIGHDYSREFQACGLSLLERKPYLRGLASMTIFIKTKENE